MGQGEDCAIGDALTQLSRLAEVIGNEDGLAVTRHQGMDSAKQNGGSDGGDNRVGVTGPRHRQGRLPYRYTATAESRLCFPLVIRPLAPCGQDYNTISRREHGL